MTMMTKNIKFDNLICKFIALDFETVVYKGSHYVYAVGIMTHNKYKSFFISLPELIRDNNSIKLLEQEVISKAIMYLLSCTNPKETTTVYIHNLSGFDSMFILNWLLYDTNNYKVSTIIRNSKVYNIKINNISFQDSYLLLPISLQKMSKLFINKDKKTLDIIKHITIDQIQENIDDIYNYLYTDVYNLYHSLIKIQSIVFDNFNICITNSLTTPSLAMRIFKLHYLQNNTIFKSNSNTSIEEFLRQTYIGGITNIFIPHNYNGENIYQYDINSSYPYQMTKPLPSGEPKWIKNPNSTIDKTTLNDLFGFLYVKIYVPYSDIPPISIKSKSKGIYQPYGVFEVNIFSEELLNSIRLYNVKVLHIYSFLVFNKEPLLKPFSTDLYNKRINSNNQGSNTLFKLILNSLYGKFAMKTDQNKTIITPNNDLKLYEETIPNINYNKITKYKTIMTLSVSSKENIYPNTPQHIKSMIMRSKNTNIAVQLASAITAYARIDLINKIKYINKSHKVYYTDTDSIFTSANLETTNKLGALKLENILTKAYFITPKCYRLITTDKQKITKFKGLIQPEQDKLSNNFFKQALTQNNNTKPITFINKILRNIKDLTIQTKHTSYKPSLNFTKRIKIFTNNIWTHTKPTKHPSPSTKQSPISPQPTHPPIYK